MQEQQVKEKQRVADYGEVFTAEREVKAMCDLVKGECERIESRFLEPACGEGAFLLEILSRKLQACARQADGSLADFELCSVLAVSSLYGVDLMPDNVDICRDKLFSLWKTRYEAFGGRDDSACCDAVRFILEKNILCGDTLTMRCQDGSPLVFAEWTLTEDKEFRRKDYQLDRLLAEEAAPGELLLTGLSARPPARKAPQGSLMLPGLVPDAKPDALHDAGLAPEAPAKNKFTPDSTGLVRQYDPVPYLRLQDAEDEQE